MSNSNLLKNKAQKTSNGWSTKKEKLLQIWMDECNIYSKLYTYNVIWYERLDNILGIVGTLLSAVTGASLLNSSDTDRPGTRNIIIIFGSLSMVNTFIQATKEYLNLKTVINSNLIASRQNRMVCIDIETQLNMNRCERINGKEFLTTIRDRKNDLVLNGPIISNRMWKKITPKYSKFKNDFKKSINNEKIYLNNTNPSNDYSSNNSSDDVVLKRRPTMEVINLTPEFNKKTSKLENIIENSINGKHSNFSNITNSNSLSHITDITNNNPNYSNNNYNNLNEELNLDINSNKKSNTTINIDFLNNVNTNFSDVIEDFSNDYESEHTEEDDDEDYFLESINNTNKACNEIKVKLSKKPINELDQELKRYHL